MLFNGTGYKNIKSLWVLIQSKFLAVFFCRFVCILGSLASFLIASSPIECICRFSCFSLSIRLFGEVATRTQSPQAFWSAGRRDSGDIEKIQIF